MSSLPGPSQVPPSSQVLGDEAAGPFSKRTRVGACFLHLKAVVKLAGRKPITFLSVAVPHPEAGQVAIQGKASDLSLG